MIRLVTDQIHELLLEHRKIIVGYLSLKLKGGETNQKKPFQYTHELLKKYDLFQLDDILEKRFTPFNEINLTDEEVQKLYKQLAARNKVGTQNRAIKQKRKKIDKFFNSTGKVIYLYDSYKLFSFPSIQKSYRNLLLFNDDFIKSLMDAMQEDELIEKKSFKNVKGNRKAIIAYLLNKKQFTEKYSNVMDDFYKNISFKSFEKEILDWLRHHDVNDIKNLNDYLGMKPEKLFECIQKLYAKQSIRFPKHNYDNLRKKYKFISYPKSIDLFPKVYELFSNEESGIKIKGVKVYSAQLFIKKFELRICPYCNRNYIQNIEVKGGGYRKIAQVDHILPKTVFPYFAISSYNLVPICSSCNFHKTDKVIFYSPYVDFSMEEQLFRFSYSGEITGRLNRDDTNIQINITGSDPAIKELSDVLELEYMYNTHLEEALDIFLLRNLYTDSRIEEIIKLMNQSNISISKSQLCEMIFGVDIVEPFYSKHPLTKLRYDAYKFLT
ncbi:HNH endonuclease [Bacillus sp. L27]|uniref:HNH endonuclease n=1 Tax=Bacillus sp. L27 TaxID=1866312 RepID=UPI0008FE2BB5|nr:HNH endonuclease signature motif containing protein [Bacillus sp. L27]OJD48996.1 hypothetical protein BAU24_12095 [Bacillus sp. L27]